MTKERERLGAVVRGSLLLVLLIVVWVLFDAGPVAGRNGVYKGAVLRADTLGDTTHAWDHARLSSALSEMHSFFHDLSYRKLDVQFSLQDASALSRSGDCYFGHWTAGTTGTCRADRTKDLAADAIAHHFSFTGFDGIAVAARKGWRDERRPESGGVSTCMLPPCMRWGSSSSRVARTRWGSSYLLHRRTVCGIRTTSARTCSLRRSSVQHRRRNRDSAPTLHGSTSTTSGTRSRR